MTAEKAKAEPSDLDLTVKKWGRKRGSLIMMLHEIQNTRGYVPRQAALELAHRVDVPLARIYEVLTFYNYFKTASPGRAVISICTGTACHLKGASNILAVFAEELGIEDGQTTDDGDFHLQTVRCVGCCGLAPVVVVNGKTYGKARPDQVKSILAEWRESFAKEEA
jgi:NADH:ubiquinone oxidoreductase subunit E